MQLHWVDLAIVAVIGLSVLTGLFRGFVKELIALGIWVVAIWIAYNYSQVLDPWLQSYIQDQSVRKAVGFVLIVIAVLILGALVNVILSLMLRSTGLSGIDKLLGMVFGFVRGIFIVSLIIAVIQMTSLPYQDYFKNSKLYPRFIPVINWISGYLPAFINQVKAVDKGATNTIKSTF